jgi:hypothetical protein
MSPLFGFLIGTIVGVALAAVWLYLANAVEEWSHAPKQTDSRTTADAVAAGVVRRRKRRPSISPWVK